MSALAHRLEELLGAVEVVQPDHHAAEALGDVAVGPGAGDDPVLGGEPLGLLVERGERDPRVEDLEDVDLLDDVEQVLVVGHRVQPVERDAGRRPARPAAGSRRSSRAIVIPRSIFSSRKRPITSPCSAVFTSSATITLIADLVGDLARRERARDLVVVGDRDRAEAALARRLEQRLDRGRAIGGVVGVHVQVDVDLAPARDSPPHLRVAPRVVAARGEPPVDRLEALGGDRRERGDGLPGATGEPRRAGRGDSASRSSCPASVSASPGGNSRPSSPSPSSSS